VAEPSIDADAAAFLQQLRESNAEGLSAGGVVERARSNNSSFLRQAGIDPVPVDSVEDLSIPSGATELGARLYRGSPEAGALLVFFHGGGWVLGDLDSYNGFCRAIAAGCAIDVLSVDYRLAPEHPFPAAVDDAIAAAAWAAETIAEERPLLVGGDSAGGNLAAIVGQRAAAGAAPALALQLLLYPVLDCNLETESRRRFGDDHLLTHADMRWFFLQYVQSPEASLDPRVSPLKAESLAGVAPAFLVVGSHDPLHDEVIAYASRLHEAGVEARVRMFDGQIHGFLTIPKAIPSAAAAMDEILGELSALLDRYCPSD
jgi:acetyl esterase